DADDWSAPHRLAWLLAEAERTGAEWIGCQGYRLLGDEGEAVPLTYPADVNAALATWPARYALLHPTSLVSRNLVQRAGGFATGLRFSGDLEFQHRAVHVGRLVNSRRFAYFKRAHPAALTARPDTGIGSPARQALWAVEAERARANAARVAAGRPPDLTPLATAGPIRLEHLAGPPLQPPPHAGSAA
ncbi:MAG TPA: hypothetical protein VFI22_04545, partial [Thermomicrobiales bacterium]|nr:hypothetical protein [Thermomicrobiales bacterium]